MLTDTTLIVALISAATAIGAAVFTFVGQRRLEQLKHELSSARDAEEKKDRAATTLAKFRDPLLRSAHSLQSRCFNIVQQGFLRIYYNKSDRDREYASRHTMFVFAEFLGWVEVLRRDVQFLDLGDKDDTRQLQRLLAEISSTLLTDALPPSFRIFSGEQRAIGELMLVERARGQGANFDCIGFAEFASLLEEPDFFYWFGRLDESISKASASNDVPERLVLTQHKLIELIDFLDPDKLRVPSARDKISMTRMVSDGDSLR